MSVKLEVVWELIKWGRLRSLGHVIKNNTDDWVWKFIDFEVEGKSHKWRPEVTLRNVRDKDIEAKGIKRPDTETKKSWDLILIVADGLAVLKRAKLPQSGCVCVWSAGGSSEVEHWGATVRAESTIAQERRSSPANGTKQFLATAIAVCNSTKAWWGLARVRISDAKERGKTAIFKGAEEHCGFFQRRRHACMIPSMYQQFEWFEAFKWKTRSCGFVRQWRSQDFEVGGATPSKQFFLQFMGQIFWAFY